MIYVADVRAKESCRKSIHKTLQELANGICFGLCGIAFFCHSFKNYDCILDKNPCFRYESSKKSLESSMRFLEEYNFFKTPELQKLTLLHHLKTDMN